MIDDVDIEFNRSLLYIWIELRELVKSTTNSGLDPSLNRLNFKMKKMANEFYKKFYNTKIPVTKNQSVYDRFNSVIIMFQDASAFAVPYFFYQQLQTKTIPDYTDTFNKNLSWLDLLSEIYEITYSIRSNITKADIKILRALCYYKRNSLFSNLDFTDQKNFLFNNNTLSDIVKLSYRWTITRINYLIANYILNVRFILNPFVFGLKTYLIEYDSQYDEKITFINPITLFKLQMTHSETLRIIQLPNIHSSTDLDLGIPYTIKNLSEMHIFNNLSGLKENSKDSFSQIPDFNSTKEFISKSIINFKETSTKVHSFDQNELDESTYPLMKKMTQERKISIIVRILDYLAKWGSVQGNLSKASKELRVNPLEFVETCKYLFNNDIIGFYPRISRIGCNNRYGLVLTDKTGEKGADLLKAYSNLLELPNSVIFIGENVLFAYVSMPDNYMPAFVKYMGILNDKFDVKYNSFITLKSWGRFSIPLPDGTTVDEYGVNFPYNVMESLKADS